MRKVESSVELSLVSGRGSGRAAHHKHLDLETRKLDSTIIYLSPEWDDEINRVNKTFNITVNLYSFNTVSDVVFSLNVICVHKAAGIVAGRFNLGHRRSIRWINGRGSQCAYGESHLPNMRKTFKDSWWQ